MEKDEESPKVSVEIIATEEAKMPKGILRKTSKYSVADIPAGVSTFGMTRS